MAFSVAWDSSAIRRPAIQSNSLAFQPRKPNPVCRLLRLEHLPDEHSLGIMQAKEVPHGKSHGRDSR
jgi:hypothetical protein